MDTKTCIACGVPLNDDNHAPEARRNWVNKCRECVRQEKREYQRKWRENNRELSRSRIRRYQRRLRENDPVLWHARAAHSQAKKRARKLGIEFRLLPDFVVALFRQTAQCPYFGWVLTHEGLKEKTSASLDRVKGALGYIPGNVQVISYLANLMKSHADADELRTFAQGVLSWDKSNGQANGH